MSEYPKDTHGDGQRPKCNRCGAEVVWGFDAEKDRWETLHWPPVWGYSRDKDKHIKEEGMFWERHWNKCPKGRSEWLKKKTEAITEKSDALPDTW